MRGKMRKVELLPTRGPGTHWLRPCTYKLLSAEGPGGGVLSVKVGTGMCGPDRVLFRPLRFSNGPFFYLKIGLDIGRIFAKRIIFVEFFLLVYL